VIYVIATLTTKPGSIPALRQPAAACIEETLKEDGCIAYELFESLGHPDRLVFVERWATRVALTAHSKTPHLAAWREASAPHLVKREIEIIHPDRVETF